MITRNVHKLQDTFPLLSVRAVDGDTLLVTIALAFETTITKRVRLKGWWAPEMTGPDAARGMAAQQRLHNFCEGKVLWILCPAQRLDRYGRVIATLMHEERIISARDVLGDLQLTEAEHKAARDAHRPAQGTLGPKAWPPCGVCGAMMPLDGVCVRCSAQRQARAVR